MRRWGQLYWASLTWTRGPPCLFSACFLLSSQLVCFSSKGSFSVSLVILVPLVSGTYTPAFLRWGDQSCTENSNHRHTMGLQSSILMFVLLLLNFFLNLQIIFAFLTITRQIFFIQLSIIASAPNSWSVIMLYILPSTALFTDVSMCILECKYLDLCSIN